MFLGLILVLSSFFHSPSAQAADPLALDLAALDTEAIEKIFAPAAADDVPVIPDGPIAETEKTEVDEVFVSEKRPSDMEVVSEPKVQTPAVEPLLAQPSHEIAIEPEIHLKKDKGPTQLPQKSVTKMTDSELRELCESLKAPNRHTMDTVAGSSLKNFRLNEPLIMRVDRLKTLNNVQGKYVVLVGSDKPGIPRVDRLKDIKKPHVFCGVKAGQIEGISAKLIFVDVKAPVALRKHPQVRSIKQL